MRKTKTKPTHIPILTQEEYRQQEQIETLKEKFNYKLETKYEITINFDNPHQHIKSITRFKDGIDTIIKHMPHEDVDWVLYPEVSMPQHGNNVTSSVCRIHFHGWIQFPNPKGLRKWLLYDWQYLTTISDVQVNNYRPEWEAYCKKQSFLWQPLMAPHTYPLTHKSVRIQIGRPMRESVTNNIMAYLETSDNDSQ